MVTHKLDQPNTQTTQEVCSDLMQQILKPYRQHTTYLQKASYTINTDNAVQGLTIKGEFKIGDSCYIDDTGHFNAVEFNICYNQLAYVHLGHSIKQGLIPALSGFGDGLFFQKQLSHFLIANLNSSYRRQLNSDHFYGEFGIKELTIKEKCTFIKTYINFYDDGKGKSEGEVTLAVLKP